MAWDPAQYQKFQRERAQPFEDALALVARRPGLRVVDLGCGTGELTRRLADALPGSDALGLDFSTEMLAKAEPQARPGLRFEKRAIEDFDGEWDLIFSHAALHWIVDHEALIPKLMSHVKDGGQLVVQIPSNHYNKAHRALSETAEEFSATLNGYRWDVPVLPVERYAEILYAAGGREITAYEKVYPHVVPDADAVVEWMRGTSMVPYLERLPKDAVAPFFAGFRRRVGELFPTEPVFYGFKRILFAATRAYNG